MKLSLVQIGVNVTVDDNQLRSPIDAPRNGWADAFKKMAKAGDDKLLNPKLNESNFDKDEWEW